MDYTHKFSGTLQMSKMLTEYYNPRKARMTCTRCNYYNRCWSCPEFGFSEEMLLNEFKYMYVIGREFTVPKEDRQKIIGNLQCKTYVREVNKMMEIESWKALMELEEAIPDVMTLCPGHCHVCELAGKSCARVQKQKCRHSDMMRFSLRALGFDVDSLCKFEMGVLLTKPMDGHLPEKIAIPLAVLSNEKIAIETLRHFFPDARKSYFKSGEILYDGDTKPTAKRKESWLDKQAEELMQKETDPDYEKRQQWIGFKSDALDSGDYVKNRSWAQGDDEYPDPPADSPYVAAQTQPVAPTPGSVAPAESESAQDMSEDVEEAIKYKWLGFKRSDEEASEMMYNRPIPKFSVSEEEKKTAQVSQAEDLYEGDPKRSAFVPNHGENISYNEQRQVEQAVARFEREAGNASKPQDTPAQSSVRAQLEDALRTQMAGMSDADLAAFLAGKMNLSMANAGSQTSLQTARQTPRRQEPQKPVSLLDANMVEDVLGAALSIAQAVKTPEQEAGSTPQAAVQNMPQYTAPAYNAPPQYATPAQNYDQGGYGMPQYGMPAQGQQMPGYGVGGGQLPPAYGMSAQGQPMPAYGMPAQGQPMAQYGMPAQGQQVPGYGMGGGQMPPQYAPQGADMGIQAQQPYTQQTAAVQPVAQSAPAPMAEPEEEDDSKYKWLGFKADPDSGEVVQSVGDTLEAKPAPDAGEGEEEDDSKYKWLGYKASVKEVNEFPQKWKKNRGASEE